MNANNEPEAVPTVAQKQKRSEEKEIAKMAPRWAAIIGLLAIGVLYALLPQRLRIGPNWLLLVIEIVALLPLVIALLTQRRFSHRCYTYLCHDTAWYSYPGISNKHSTIDY